MLSNQLKSLVKINMLLLNPQATDRFRKKGFTGKALSKRLLRQSMIGMLIFVLIYGAVIAMVDLSKMPGMFTFYVALFILLSFSQSISGIYNVFFAGKDLPNYLPLPFKQRDIFLSKIIVLSINIVPFTFPMLIVFFVTAWRGGMMVLLALLWSIVGYLAILALIFMICSLIVFGLVKTKLFKKHQNLVMSSLMTISLVVAIGGIMIMNNNVDTQSGADRGIIGFLMPLYTAFTEPFSLESGLTWLVLILAVLAFAMILKRFVLPHLSDQLTSVNSTLSGVSSKRKHRQFQGLTQSLDAYNRQLLKEPNLILQVVINSIMVPLILVLSFAFADLSRKFDLKWIGVFFVAGMLMSVLTTNQSSLISNLISLDRENFEFVQSLPISMKQYLRRKFRLGYFFQVIVNLIMIIILVLIMGLPLMMAGILTLGMVLGTYLMCLHFFRRDYRLRSTNWTNITELFNRGGGNFTMMLTIFASVFVSAIIIGAYAFATALLPTNIVWLINAIVAVAIVIVSIICYRNYQQQFLNKFA